jgi:hypothetical protein
MMQAVAVSFHDQVSAYLPCVGSPTIYCHCASPLEHSPLTDQYAAPAYATDAPCSTHKPIATQKQCARCMGEA